MSHPFLDLEVDSEGMLTGCCTRGSDTGLLERDAKRCACYATLVCNMPVLVQGGELICTIQYEHKSSSPLEDGDHFCASQLQDFALSLIVER